MAPDAAARRNRAAVSVLFFLNGAIFTSFFARLPQVKADLGLSDGELGGALLCATGGLVIAQPVAGALAVRFGSRPVCMVGALGYAAGVALAAAVDSLLALALALGLAGIANGALDVAMNVQGVTVERRYPKPILAGLHAAFSFGALAGSGSSGLVAELGAAREPHLAAVAALCAAATLLAYRDLLPAAADATPVGPRLARPSRALAGLAAIAFCVLLAEGAVADWSAVYLSDTLGASPGPAAAALATFSLAMAIGRLAGDRLALALGPVALAQGGALTGCAGLTLALVAGEPVLAIAGFGLMGAGLSCLFPLVVRAAAARSASEAGPAIAAVSGAGYVGFMAGPATIGFIAELSSLRAALVLVAVLCAAAATLGRGLSERASLDPRQV
jgi:MFS family permease